MPADFTRPNTARVCEFLAGGCDYLPPDQAEADRLLEICPELRMMVKESRAFTGRAVTWAAGKGIRQFLDLGTGLAARTSVHEFARQAAPAARVVYADHDPVVVAHSRALRDCEGVVTIAADLAGPAAVLAHPGLREVIDPAEPVCVILGLVLSLMPAGQAREVVAGYTDLVAPGSIVVISALRFADGALWKDFRDTWTTGPLHNHSPRQLGSFLAGLYLVPPGIAQAAGLRPGWGDAPAGENSAACVLAAVARKL